MAILSPGTRIGGKYEVVEVIGFGGMGVVYKVREQVGAVSRIRALKTVLPQHADDPEVVARFRQEAEKMCMLEHENIVPVLSYSEEGQFPYLIMPFIEGQTLKDYLAAHIVEHGRPLPLHDVMQIGLEIARGLQVAHGFVDPQTGRPSPMVHRDIKPGNVMVRVEDHGGERRLRIQIMDFGIAKVVSGQDSGHSLTGVIGTVRYASPEQIRRGKDIDPRADIYSLGMVLFELYSGRHMFADMTEYSVLLRLAQHEVEENQPEFPEGAPDAFRELIRRSVAVDRNRRFGTVAEMQPIMRRILDDDSGRRAIEARRAEEHVEQARTAALGRDAAALVPSLVADAESLLEQARRSEDPSLGIRLFHTAALAFERAAEAAAREQERRRLADGVAGLEPLRAAAL
ncbi:MAG: serine/threonine protein kinase, partial [Candidatus Binatia bacterium]